MCILTVFYLPQFLPTLDDIDSNNYNDLVFHSLLPYDSFPYWRQGYVTSVTPQITSVWLSICKTQFRMFITKIMYIYM